jgi:hypothetical protein
LHDVQPDDESTPGGCDIVAVGSFLHVTPAISNFLSTFNGQAVTLRLIRQYPCWLPPCIASTATDIAPRRSGCAGWRGCSTAGGHSLAFDPFRRWLPAIHGVALQWHRMAFGLESVAEP